MNIDEEGRKIILRFRHDEGCPKGKVWCDGYHEGLVDMFVELKKILTPLTEDKDK